MLNHSLNVVASLPTVDPGISPNMDAPWMGFFQLIGGYVLGTCITVVAIILTAGIVMALAGKLTKTQQMQGTGFSIVLYCLLAAVLLGSVTALISWATGIPLF